MYTDWDMHAYKDLLELAGSLGTGKSFTLLLHVHERKDKDRWDKIVKSDVQHSKPLLFKISVSPTGLHNLQTTKQGDWTTK